MGILYIQVIYGRIFKTYTNNIRAYTDADVPSVCCLYTFVCAFVYVRMCLYNCIIQTLYVRIRTIYVHIRLCTYNILGCCIDLQYTYEIRTYFRILYEHIWTYTDADIPYVCCSYTFVCAFVYVRMCLYNCIIQTLYVRIQTTYVHIRMCTYNILDCCIDRQYTNDIRTYFQDQYEQYTSVYGRIRTVRILFVFVRMCVCICTYVFV